MKSSVITSALFVDGSSASERDWGREIRIQSVFDNFRRLPPLSSMFRRSPPFMIALGLILVFGRRTMPNRLFAFLDSDISLPGLPVTRGYSGRSERSGE
jgi:hypothetical protein